MRRSSCVFLPVMRGPCSGGRRTTHHGHAPLEAHASRTTDDGSSPSAAPYCWWSRCQSLDQVPSSRSLPLLVLRTEYLYQVPVPSTAAALLPARSRLPH